MYAMKNKTTPRQPPPVPSNYFLRLSTNVRSAPEQLGNALRHDVVDGIRRMQAVEPEELVDGVTAALNEGIPFGGAAADVSTHIPSQLPG